MLIAIGYIHAFTLTSSYLRQLNKAWIRGLLQEQHFMLGIVSDK